MTLQFDMGIDYREFPPATLSIGPVLDARDAVANKLGAMCSRGEPRDYLDADAIRLSKLFGDAELLALTFDHDPGITKDVLARSLKAVVLITPEEVGPYGCNGQQLESVKQRLLAWAEELSS